MQRGIMHHVVHKLRSNGMVDLFGPASQTPLTRLFLDSQSTGRKEQAKHESTLAGV